MTRRTYATFLSVLNGKRCWHVSAGGVTLPSFELALGRKVKRERPLWNRAQPKVFREYDPEVSLLVWCTWRLEVDGQSLATSRSGDRKLVSGLNQLRQRRVRRATLSRSGDLQLTFDSRYGLVVFCDIPKEPNQLSTQWEVFFGGRVLSVDQGGEIALTPSAGPLPPTENHRRWVRKRKPLRAD